MSTSEGQENTAEPAGDVRPLVEVRGVVKRFAGVQALRGVDLDIQPGTIHALVGENGAGKSTLGKIIAGALRADGGTLRVDGREVSYRSPRDALADGVVLIAQELELVPELSVAANVLLGGEPRAVGMIRRRALRAKVKALIEQSGFELDPGARLGDLRVAQQQQVEILRAVARNARLIVMDEPTAALTLEEVEKLHGIVRRLRAGGTAVVYVSHFLKEVLVLADTVTVLRNGKLIRTAPASQETESSLVTAMLGRSTEVVFPPRALPPADAPVIFSVRNLSRKGVLHDISFDVRAGEIVGVAGLLGSGRSELARSLFRADPLDVGEIELDGKPLDARSPRSAYRAGLVLLPEDRKKQGLVMDLSVAHNMMLPHVSTVSSFGFVRLRAEARQVSTAITNLDIVTRSARTTVNKLSGGNQQKVLFGKCLLREPRVLMLDEPTRGVDVGAKLKIYELIHDLAAQGIGILLISSELEEILGLSHRVLVMRLGRIIDQFENHELEMNTVMRAAFGMDASDRAAVDGTTPEGAIV